MTGIPRVFTKRDSEKQNRKGHGIDNAENDGAVDSVKDMLDNMRINISLRRVSP